MTKRARQREKAGRVTDRDGYKGDRVPENHWPTTADFEEMPDSGDFAMIRRSIKERWPVRQEARGPLADMMTRIALDQGEETKDQIQAARTVLTMDTLNQKDEHKEQPDKLEITVTAEERMAQILERLEAEIERRGLKLPPPDDDE